MRTTQHVKNKVVGIKNIKKSKTSGWNIETGIKFTILFEKKKTKITDKICKGIVINTLEIKTSDYQKKKQKNSHETNKGSLIIALAYSSEKVPSLWSRERKFRQSLLNILSQEDRVRSLENPTWLVFAGRDTEEKKVAHKENSKDCSWSLLKQVETHLHLLPSCVGTYKNPSLPCHLHQ